MIPTHHDPFDATLAAVVPGTSEQRLQHLLTDMAWDAEDLNRQRVARMLELETEGDAVLILDDTGFPKQGRASAGVQRQLLGHARQDRQLPGCRELPLRRAHHRVARSDATLPAEELGGGRRPPAPRARVPRDARRTTRPQTDHDGK
jgi:hypothetical protein